MSISAFLSRVREIIASNIENKTPERVESELSDLVRSSGVSSGFGNALAKEVQSFVDENTTKPAREIFEVIAKQGNADFAKTVKGVMRDIAQDVMRLLNEGATVRTIQERLELRYSRVRNVAQTIAVTSRVALSRANTIVQAERAGVKRLRYVGAPPEREFCADHFNQVYTIDQIRKMDNGMGLPVEYYCGGWRCKHRWIAES